MKRLVVEAEKCSGCRLCEVVCSFAHEGVFSPRLSRVTVVKEDRHGLDYPVFCRQCESCPPTSACTTGALTRNQAGTLEVDEGSCVGCSSCVGACTYGALKLDGGSKPIACDLCGGAPACVDRCPTQALEHVESDVFTERPEEAFGRLSGMWGIHG